MNRDGGSEGHRDPVMCSAATPMRYDGNRNCVPYSVAEHHVARDSPFLLASGYGDWAPADMLQDRPSSEMPGIRLTHGYAMTESRALPGVKTNTQGRHSSSTTA